MAIPTVFSVGTAIAGATSLNPVPPSHQADDILIMVFENGSTVGTTLSGSANNAGWADITNSPRAQGSNVTALNVFWKRATSSSEPTPQTNAAGNHAIGFIFCVRGCITSGNPWDFTPVGSGAASSGGVDGPFSATGGTTSVADTLVIIASASQSDQPGPPVGYRVSAGGAAGAVNASLSGLTEVLQATTTSGNDGSISVFAGGKAVAGATGTTTGVIPVAAAQSNLVFALVPSSVTGYVGDAAVAEVATITASGAVGKVASASVAETAALTASGIVGKQTSASVAPSVAITATGTMAATGTANVAETATLTASGAVGKVTSASVAETAALTASGIVGTAASASVAESVALTAAGAVGAVASASVAPSVAITASGTVSAGGGALTAAANVAESVAITGAGYVGKQTSASVAETATLTASGQVGKLTTASVAETAALTATGRVGKLTSASVAPSVAITATGTLAAAGTAQVAASVAITATGVVTSAHQPADPSRLSRVPGQNRHPAVVGGPRISEVVGGLRIAITPAEDRHSPVVD